MGSYHPHEAHWYLPLIGVDPAHQRNGFGAALLRDTLRQCDSDHAVAYLESTNAANVPLYKRHGFEVIGTIQVGSSPPTVSDAARGALKAMAFSSEAGTGSREENASKQGANWSPVLMRSEPVRL